MNRRSFLAGAIAAPVVATLPAATAVLDTTITNRFPDAAIGVLVKHGTVQVRLFGESEWITLGNGMHTYRGVQVIRAIGANAACTVRWFGE